MIESYYVKLDSASYEISNGTPTKFVRNTLLQSSTRAHKGSYFSYGFFLPRFFQINRSGVKILQPAIFAIATHLIAAYFQVLNTRRFNSCGVRTFSILIYRVLSAAKPLGGYRGHYPPN